MGFSPLLRVPMECRWLLLIVGDVESSPPVTSRRLNCIGLPCICFRSSRRRLPPSILENAKRGSGGVAKSCLSPTKPRMGVERLL
ncbi:hypothetical protein BKA70DRAFT_1296729 [Coprinopsis sp. MPI-PUGE-AT-0042]|nr:hypothetical protein BKA70DRAFT_1296729 [Coprinopsis sp. MPI-PUGE-AT-0042]